MRRLEYLGQYIEQFLAPGNSQCLEIDADGARFHAPPDNSKTPETSMSEFVNLSPTPLSLIESLRNLGYSIQTAVADILDNSIYADAVEIHIDFSWNTGNPWLAITDNGYGMSKEELIAAMRFGSLNPLALRSTRRPGAIRLGSENRLALSMPPPYGNEQKEWRDILLRMGPRTDLRSKTTVPGVWAFWIWRMPSSVRYSDRSIKDRWNP